MQISPDDLEDLKEIMRWRQAQAVKKWMDHNPHSIKQQVDSIKMTYKILSDPATLEAIKNSPQDVRERVTRRLVELTGFLEEYLEALDTASQPK